MSDPILLPPTVTSSVSNLSKIPPATLSASVLGPIQTQLQTLAGSAGKNAQQAEAQIQAFMAKITPDVEEAVALAVTGDQMAQSTADILAGQIKGYLAEIAVSQIDADENLVLSTVSTAIKVAVSVLLAAAVA